MKLTFALFLIISISQPIYSQTNLIIKSVDIKSILPFATIYNVSKGISFSANEKGLTKVKSSLGDTLLITYVGYLDQYFKVEQVLDLDTIFMERNVKLLPEVYIKSCKKFINYSFSNKNKNEPKNYFYGVQCSTGNHNGKVAFKIRNELYEGKLMSFSFWLKSMSNKVPQNAFKSPFIISFYSISESNLPDELLYQDPVFYFPQKKGKQILNIDTANIWLPKEGIFICFEYIMDERYQWEEILTDTIITRQGVIIDGQLSNENDLSYYDFSESCWKHFYRDSSTRKSTIKIEAILKYCK